MVQKLLKAIQTIPLTGQKTKELTKPGQFIYELLQAIEITFDNSSRVLTVIENALDILSQGIQS
jgi:hypothetical protein